jgi:hypothetical protein
MWLAILGTGGDDLFVTGFNPEFLVNAFQTGAGQPRNLPRASHGQANAGRPSSHP